MWPQRASASLALPRPCPHSGGSLPSTARPATSQQSSEVATRSRTKLKPEEKEALLKQIKDPETERQELVELAATCCLGQQFASAEEYREAIAAACGPRRLWVVALAVLEEMRDRGMDPSIPVYVAVLSSFSRVSWQKAVSLLNDMQEEHVDPGASGYRALLGVLQHSKKWEQALELLSSMSAAGHPPGIAAYAIAVKACEEGGQDEHVKRLAAAVHVVLLRQQLAECAKEGQWDKSLELLMDFRKKGLPADLECYTSGITVCADSAYWAQALKLISDLRKSNCDLDRTSYSVTIHACAFSGRWDQMVVLMKEMQQLDLGLSLETFSLAIAACGLAGQWQWAIFWLRELQKTGTTPTLVTWENALKAAGKAGEWRWVLALLEEMKEAGLAPSASAYTVAIEACQEAGELDWVEELKEEAGGLLFEDQDLLALRSTLAGMRNEAERWAVALALLQKLRPAAAHDAAAAADAFNDAITSCAQCGRWLTAVELIAAMKAETGQSPSEPALVQTLTAMSRMGHWESALALLMEHQGGIPKSVTPYNIVLEACLKGGALKSAEALSDEMQSANLQPDITLYNELLNAMAPGERAPVKKSGQGLLTQMFAPGMRRQGRTRGGPSGQRRQGPPPRGGHRRRPVSAY